MIATDGTLLERWIAWRDAEAFNELVSRHANLVYGVCRRIVRNDSDAEDLAQDCFLKLAGVSYVPHSSFVGWLHTVAVRSAADLLRARSRRRDREMHFAEVRAQERPADSTWDELREYVDAGIAELPEELREVIVAHFLERKTHEAVAMSLGVSRQTVTNRIQKGIGRLRVVLKKRGITASGAALASIFSGLPVEAAPATLLASLGRLALAGPPVSAVSATSLIISTIAKIGTHIMAKKLLISGVTALVLVLLGGFTVFHHLSEPVDPIASVRAPSPLPLEEGPKSEAGTAFGQRLTREPAETTKSGEATHLLGNSLVGRVLDVDGRPVGEAKVVAVDGLPGRPEKVFETISDETGRFRLEPLERDEDEVAVWSFKRGVGLGATTVLAAGLEVILKPLCEVSGRFYDRETGEGIAGLSVRLSLLISGVSPEVISFYSDAQTLFPELHQKDSVTVTDPDGSYVFQEVSPVRLRFGFEPDSSRYVLPGCLLDDSLPEILLAPGERRSGVDFALQRGGSIAGTVFGPDGKTLPGARVEVLASYPMPIKRARQCDPDGSYRFIGLAPNATYVVSASHQGLPPGESATIAMPDDDPIEGVDIHLERGNSVRGRFVDDLSQPVAGIDVYLSKLSESDRRSSGYGGTVTGDDGSFSYENVAPGKHAVWPSSNLHLTGEVFAFTMPAGRDLSGLQFVLRRKAPGFISGRVVDHLGKPVAGFPVNAQIGLKTVGLTVSGEDGAFRLDGLGDAEVYTVTAYSGEYWSARQLAVPLYSADVTLVVIQRGRIVGRVVEAGTRKPLEHFEVRAVFIRTEPSGSENRFHLKWTPFASEAGAFLIERAEPVECEIQVRADGYVEAKSPRFSIPPGGASGEVVIALSRGASVEGTVLDAQTGEPVPGVHVRAHQHDDFFPWLLQEGKASYAPRGVWMLTMSRADGTFEFSGLVSGETIHLVAWKDGYSPSVRPGVAVGQEGNTLKVSLARAATLLISTRFRSHAGERYEFHAYHREEKPWRSAFHASAEAARPGTVEISRLPPGPYRLAVYSSKQEGASVSRRLLGEERLKLAPDERHEVLFDLDDFAKRFASVSGRVIGRFDQGGVRLHIISDEDPEESYAYSPARPGPDGSFRFTGLPAGRYIILATSDTIKPAVEVRLPVQVGARENLDVELTLE